VPDAGAAGGPVLSGVSLVAEGGPAVMDWEGSAQEAGGGESGRSLRHLICVTAFEFCNMLHMKCVMWGTCCVAEGCPAVLDWEGAAHEVGGGESAESTHGEQSVNQQM
jgi:hypothetical protein